MFDFEKLCFDTKKKLGRALKEKELEFLRWLYERHMEEIAKENKINGHNEWV